MIVVVLYGKLGKRHPVGVSVLLALGIVAAIGAFYAMMALGRLVYPVNGLPLTQQQVYYPRVNCLLGCIGWRWHWLHVLLEVAVITKSRIIILTSACVALLKVVGTYYAGSSVVLTVVSEVTLLGWSLS